MALSALRDDSRDYHRKGQLNLRLSDDGKAALRALSNLLGIGLSDVVEMLVREKAHEKGLKFAPNRTHKKRRK